MSQVIEKAFEDELCAHLAAHGWLYSPNDDGYDRQRALFPDDVFGWLADTQPEAGFEPVAAGLEDVYFGQLTRHRASLAA